MSLSATLGELDFSALMSSKICHDLVGPVGAINNGLELLEEEEDEQTRAYAFQLIQNSARTAAARLEFARLAFGASTGLGGNVDLGYAEKIARGFVEDGKHRLHWAQPGSSMPKDRLRLLLIMLCISMHAVPGGGDITVSLDKNRHSHFEIRCTGRTARVPEEAARFFKGEALDDINPRSILAYYAARLAQELGLKLTVEQAYGDILFVAEQRR